MANPQNIGELFNGIAQQVSNISTSLGSQTISQMVTPFDGNSKQYNRRIRSIEKVTFLNGMDDNNKKLAAFQTARGGVSDFIQRFMTNTPATTWPQFKQQLSARFGEVIDEQHAFSMLQEVKQNSAENVQMFA